MTEEEYQEEETKLFDDQKIPEVLRPELSYFAYDQWHGYGYDEILNHLQDLIYALSPPLQTLIEQAKQTNQ
jgi:hypothetical protein